MEDVMNQEQQVKEEETITVDVEDSQEKVKIKEEPEQLFEFPPGAGIPRQFRPARHGINFFIFLC